MMQGPTDEEREAARLRFQRQERELQSKLCHPGSVEYTATMGAPGVGQAWTCSECGKAWVRIGTVFIDVDGMLRHPDQEPPWVLTPEDVR